ncbi:hypothetical protein RQP46_010669 [Phenoliferia psychrophenolica]
MTQQEEYAHTPRRGAIKHAPSTRPSTTVPRSRTSSSMVQRTSSPQLSRRSSAVWGRAPLAATQANVSAAGGRNSPLRPSYGSSRRISDMATAGSSGYASPNPYEQNQRYESDNYPRAPQPYSPAPLQRAPLPSLARPSPSHRPATTQTLPPPLPPHSPNPRRRFTDTSLPTQSSSSRTTLKRQHHEDEPEPVKRWKHESDDDDDESAAGMDLDDREEEAEVRQVRGTKRSNRDDQDGRAKRSRRDDFEEDDDDSEDEMDEDFVVDEDEDEESSSEAQETEEDDGKQKKKRRPASPDESLRGPVGKKRAKAGRSTKPGSKRFIDDVDASSDELVDESSNHPHNADSDSDPNEDDPVRPKRKDGKRFRESRRRRDSNDLDVMDGTFDEPAPSSAPTPKKRTLPPTRKAAGGSLARPSPASHKSKTGAKIVRRIGEEWINGEGQRLRIERDGVQRKLCEVREIRKKFKMPKDSSHPDRDVTHEVIAEKWLTDAEYSQHLSSGLLAWQPSFDFIKHLDDLDDVDREKSVDERTIEVAEWSATEFAGEELESWEGESDGRG